MGFKFRKSKKILPGVKLNFSKKGVGVSFGGKRARYSISPTGRRTTSFKIAPGLTYSTSSGGSRKRVKKRTNSYKKRSAAYEQPKANIKNSNAAAIIIGAVAFIFLGIFSVELNFNPILTKTLFIIILIFVVAFMLINNIPSLKMYILNLILKNKNENNNNFSKDLQHLDLSNELMSHETKTVDMSEYSAANSLRIFRDSIKIISETANPDTFFSRYEILLREASKIETFSDRFNFYDLDPKTLYQEVQNNKQEQIYHMIVRYWNKTFTEAEKLKTDSGKIKRYEKFYNSLEQYKDEMSEENIRYYTNKYESAILH